MERVNTRNDLKNATEDVVLVTSVDRVYKRHDDEWIEKAKFTIEEVAVEIDVPYQTLTNWVRYLHFGNFNNRRRVFTLKELRVLIRVKKLREEGIRFEQINIILHANRHKAVRVTRD